MRPRIHIPPLVRLLRRCCACGLLFAALPGVCVRSQPQPAGTSPVRLTIDTDHVAGRVDEGLYGHFLEHIYHSCNGGLWGDVIWNRSFEERDTAPDGFSRHWRPLGDGRLRLESGASLNSRTHARITCESPGAGVAQSNLCVRAGDTLRGSIWLRGSATDGILVRLRAGENVLASQPVSAPAGDWAECPLDLTPAAAADDATLEILTRGAADLHLDQVSLMPDSYRANGGFRTDLLQALADLRPASLRWPGGTFIEGYRWKNGIGPQHLRTDKGRVQWDEVDPLSIGIDEFVALCRKVGAEPVVVVNTGPRDQTVADPEFLQDAVDLLEYCNGAATSTWGRVRARNGHPEPHRITFWELDNEVYLSRMNATNYLRIAETYARALKERDASVVLIGCGGGGASLDADKGWQRDILAGDLKSWDLVSLHKYENYRGQGAGHADDTDRFYRGVALYDDFLGKLAKAYPASSNPDLRLYVSEWNYMSIDWRTGLYAGGLLNAMERHGDRVTMACPALLFRHVDAPEWDNAFINFDHRGWFPAPNYVVMKLWRDHIAPNRLTLSGDPGGLNAIATADANGKRVVAKLVNPNGEPRDVSINIGGAFVPTTARLTLVAPDDLLARNTLAARDAVKPVPGTVRLEGRVVTFHMPRWSVAALEITP